MKKIIFSLSGLSISLFSAAQVVTFNYSDSIKSYTIPACVDSIKIEVKGAQGGYSNYGSGRNGGLGADITGTYIVTSPGQVLNILAGGMGVLNAAASGGMQLNGGGGGGSFVWRQSDSTLIIAAGGGGGANSCSFTAGGNGLATLGGSGLGGISYCGASCDNGNGVGGGGAGWLGNGAPSCGPSNATCAVFAYSPLNGGAGGVNCGLISPYSGGAGGFGGGGAGDGNCGGGGGGGGYNGGNAGGNTLVGGCSGNGSQGGTSYNIGDNQTNISGSNSGNGIVILTLYTGVTPMVSISPTEIPCSGGTGSATATASCGTAPYTYSWAPGGQTTSTVTGLTAGTYTLTVKDKTGATTTASVTIFKATLNPNLVVNSNVLCNGGNGGKITASPSGGTAPYTYTWAPGGQTSASISNLTAGCYTVTVKDVNGCSATASACITQPTVLTVTTGSIVNEPCNGNTVGSITATASGGTPPYTYGWSDGGTGATITGLSAGCYTVTVNDNNGCSATATACITEPPVLTVTIGSVVNISCNGGNNGSMNATPSGGTPAYTYSWTPTGGTSASINNLTAGCYTITVTDMNGCTATASTCITQPPVLKITGASSTPDTICPGNCASLNATVTGGTPAYNYLWTNGATSNPINVCPVVTTIYTVSITDAHGCTYDSTIKVVVITPPIVTFSAAKDSLCVNATKDSLIGAPLGGIFSGAGVVGNNFNASAAGAGIHKIMYTYTDHYGCTYKDSVNIVVNACTGINEVSALGEQIKFYPNPFSQSVNIDIGIDGPVNITMFNMIGQNVGSWQMDKGLNTINTSSMPSGVYMIEVKTKNGVLNKKLVKMN
jgi:hypothetical protein